MRNNQGTNIHTTDAYWGRLRERYLPGIQHCDFQTACLGLPMAVVLSPAQQSLMAYREPPFVTAQRFATEVDDCRRLVAELIRAAPSCVYFDTTTTSSLGTILRSLRLESTDEIITTNDEYGSILHALEWQANGARVVSLPADRDLTSRIATAITSQTKLLVVSHITHAQGNILPVEEIAGLAKEHNVYFVVDAAQSVGQIPVDVSRIDPDALIGCGHKWLRGMTTTGIIYVSDRRPALQMAYSSPFSLPPRLRNQPIRQDSSLSIESEYIEYSGLGNSERIAHLRLALLAHQEVGWPAIYERLQHLGAVARQELAKNHFVELLTPERSAPAIIPLRVKGMNQEEVFERLSGADIITTLKKAEELIRVAVSQFTALEEIAQLNRALYDIGNGGGLGTSGIKNQ